MTIHNPLAGNCSVPSNSKSGIMTCALCARPPGSPVPMRAVKVTSGKIVHAISEHGEATSPRTTAVGVDAPDGTYLRLDYVLDMIDEALLIDSGDALTLLREDVERRAL